MLRNQRLAQLIIRSYTTHYAQAMPNTKAEKTDQSFKHHMLKKKETGKTRKLYTGKTCRGISRSRIEDAGKRKRHMMTYENERHTDNWSTSGFQGPNRLLFELSRRFSSSLLARFKPSPIFFVRRQSCPIRCMRTAATTTETAERNLLRGVRVEVRSRAWTPISEIIRRSASLLWCVKPG